MNIQSHGQSRADEPAPGVGRLLKASRLRCGEELNDVAALLCIRHAYIEAIEEDRFQDLPGQAYAIGFIRAYAEHLGLDSDEVVRRYKEDSAEVAKTNLDFPIPVPEKGVPGGAILFVGVAVAVLAYGGWYLNTAKEGYFTDLISPLPERLASLVGKDDAAEAGPSPTLATADETTPVPAEPAPEESRVAEDVERIPPQSGPETSSEETLPPSPPVETADTPPGTVESDPVPAEADGGGDGEAVPAEIGPADSPEAGVASGAAPEEGESAATARPDVAATVEEEAPAAGGQEQADSPPATAEVVQDAAGTEQSVEPPASGDAQQDAANSGQTAPPPVTGEVVQAAAEAEQTAPLPVTGEVAQAAAEAEQTAPMPAAGEVAQAPAEAEQAAPTPAPGEAELAAAGTEQVAAAPAAETEQAAAPAAETEQAAAPAAETEQVAAQATGATSRARVFGAGDETSRIVVRAVMNSWIQIRDDADNRLLVTRMLRAGDSYRVPDRQGLKLLTGNAGALEILVDGEFVPSIGPVGKVLRAVALDSERLRRGSAVDD